MIKDEYFPPKRKSVKLEQYIFSEISLSIWGPCITILYGIPIPISFIPFALHRIEADLMPALVGGVMMECVLVFAIDLFELRK